VVATRGGGGFSCGLDIKLYLIKWEKFLVDNKV